MYFFTSQTPPKKINKTIPRVANSSYRLFFRKKKINKIIPRVANSSYRLFFQKKKNKFSL